MDYFAAAGALGTSLTALKDIGTVAFGAHNAQVAMTAKLEFMEKLIEAQTKLSQITAAIVEKDGVIASQSQRIRELEAMQSERARYELHKLSVSGNVFAYRLKDAAALAERPDEPVHFICQPCFDSGRKVVLQGDNTYSSDGGIPVLTCPVCRVTLAFHTR